MRKPGSLAMAPRARDPGFRMLAPGVGDDWALTVPAAPPASHMRKQHPDHRLYTENDNSILDQQEHHFIHGARLRDRVIERWYSSGGRPRPACPPPHGRACR